MAKIINKRMGFLLFVPIIASMLVVATLASAQGNGVRANGQGKHAQVTAQ